MPELCISDFESMCLLALCPGSHLPGEMLKPGEEGALQSARAQQRLPPRGDTALPGNPSLSPGLSFCQEHIPKLKDQCGQDAASLNCLLPCREGCVVPSPEQGEEKLPYPPAKKGDKPGALARVLRDIFLAGGLQVGSCQFLLLDFSWS